MGEKKRILIVAKTYPLPSKSYMELVCTGGVLEDGSFIRLYPLDYRYREPWEQFKKYQWIEVEVEKNPIDPRPESYRPVSGSKIRILGEPLKTTDNWAERKRYVLKKGVKTMCSLQNVRQDQCSMGIIHPHEVQDMHIELVEREWKARWKAYAAQLDLFGRKRKPLEKIPYKFSYVYRCDEEGCRGHTQMIVDWEVGQLYRKMRDLNQSEEIAVQKVKEKLFNEICGPDVDTHFFVGTVLKYSSWVIVGVFRPKKQEGEEDLRLL